MTECVSEFCGFVYLIFLVVCRCKHNLRHVFWSWQFVKEDARVVGHEELVPSPFHYHRRHSVFVDEAFDRNTDDMEISLHIGRPYTPVRNRVGCADILVISTRGRGSLQFEVQLCLVGTQLYIRTHISRDRRKRL